KEPRASSTNPLFEETFALISVSSMSVESTPSGAPTPSPGVHSPTQISSLKGLPPLAGLCRFDQAVSPGLAVDDCVERLRRYHYALRRLHQILTARITAEPIYEFKMAMSLHAYYCSEHVAAIRTRVREMRDPPLRLERVPDDSLAILFDEILAAP